MGEEEMVRRLKGRDKVRGERIDRLSRWIGSEIGKKKKRIEKEFGLVVRVVERRKRMRN